MARISTFMYAESTGIEVNGTNQKMQINGPMHLFQPLFVPSQFSFSVIMGILGMDTEQSNTIRFTFSSPKKEIIIDTNSITLQPQPMEQGHLPPELRGMMMNLDFRNVPLREEGEYYSEVFLIRYFNSNKI